MSFSFEHGAFECFDVPRPCVLSPRRSVPPVPQLLPATVPLVDPLASHHVVSRSCAGRLYMIMPCATQRVDRGPMRQGMLLATATGCPVISPIQRMTCATLRPIPCLPVTRDAHALHTPLRSEIA